MRGEPHRGLSLSLWLVLLCASLLGAAPAQATFPGQNGRLVFVSGGIFTVNPDGTGLFRVAETVNRVTPGDPAWSPDGNRIAVAAGGIWVINADGTGLRQISGTALGDFEPTWSPDGARLAFTRGPDLFVIGLDGSGLTNLTGALTQAVRDPEFSPDGTRLVVDDQFDLLVVNADGSGAVDLIPEAIGREEAGSWSPDGSRIAYSRQGQIRVVASDGSGDAPLSSGLRETWEVAWSPDGTRIGFIHDDGSPTQEQLWTMNADGSGPAPLIANSTRTRMDWGVKGTLEPGGGGGSGSGIGSTTEPPAPPVAGESVVVRELRGAVTVRLPAAASAASFERRPGPFAGAAQAGFVPLNGAANIPVGALVNTTRGTLRLGAAQDRAATPQVREVDVTSGIFQILQQARVARPTAELRLSGGSFRSCRSSKDAHAAQRRTVRRLRVNGRGRFRTRGRFSAATVRGTDWTTTDRCDGTLTTVRSGSVTVRDLVRNRTVRVAAGQRYLAAARR